jgi:DNA-binding response OmpR family regulator
VTTLAERYLTLAGHEVIAGATPSKALSLASGRRIDVIVCDRVLPEMSGSELAARVLREQEGAAVVFTSARPPAGSAELGRRAGDPVFLGKPFDASELVAAVAEAAERARNGRR